MLQIIGLILLSGLALWFFGRHRFHVLGTATALPLVGLAVAFMLLFPKLSAMGLNYLILKHHKPVEPANGQ